MKRQLRQEMKLIRAAVPDREQRSQLILQRVEACQQYRQAQVVLFYVDVRDEVQTTSLLAKELQSGKVVAVPYCSQGELQLVQLKSLQELDAGLFGLQEPSLELRHNKSRVLAPQQIDCALVPGLAFDEQGGRLGHGKGYYDKLLARLRNDCLKIGLAFREQVVPSIPLEDHDIKMDALATDHELKLTATLR